MALIDALLGKEVQSSSHFRFFPQCGIRYAIVRQKFNLNYLGGMFTALGEELVRMKNKFWGIGPYGSLGIKWFFAPQFSLFASGGISAPYGQFYLHENEERSVAIFGLRDTFSRIAVIADTSIALCWQKAWERKKLSLHAGWDYMLLFQQNRLVRFFETSPLENPGSGNLGLKGWEWGMQLDF